MGEIGLQRETGRLRAVLGSCIAVVLYHPRLKLGTMAHVLLPSSAGQKDALVYPGKYADSAVDALVHLMKAKSGDLREVVAKVAGGANMFAEFDTKMMARIGPENDRMILDRLRAHNIPVTGRDTGGFDGRVVEFDVAAGFMKVSKSGRPAGRI